MKDVEKLKLKLQQKKNRIAAEETKLNIKERKMRTRHLIEMGGLVAKVKLDHLPVSTLLGAMLSLQDQLAKNDNIKQHWTEIGKAALDKEEKSRTAIILKFDEQPSTEVRAAIRSHGLKWNKLRQEWYGYTANVNDLKEAIKDSKHSIEVV